MFCNRLLPRQPFHFALETMLVALLHRPQQRKIRSWHAQKHAQKNTLRKTQALSAFFRLKRQRNNLNETVILPLFRFVCAIMPYRPKTLFQTNPALAPSVTHPKRRRTRRQFWALWTPTFSKLLTSPARYAIISRLTIANCILCIARPTSGEVPKRPKGLPC